ncbi:unnamed protein product [Rhizophagus irregularis]|uniref:HMG box domain-containing protein n=1 Tax=Rhizophagus irregularis TaxID=588596 RepID=A0A2I1GRP8_9GLOM|nr:hypothetical protein RhiirA4_465158 [Rhizophagus irregularis]CAB4430871.1 unnamed protein product [Rhizophagus irregularis]CAB4430988.1 unnamed protein product [Rhizophagus irregularis]
MSQENIISTSAASAVELAKNQRKIIYKNIQVNHPIKLSFNTFCPRKLRNGRYSRLPNCYIVFYKQLNLELEGHNKLNKYFRLVISKKWHKLSDDTKEIYSDFCIDVCEYYAYKTKPPTYQLIKF